MRILVLGAGRMGRAAAWDLARQPGVEQVVLADRDPGALERAADELARLLAPLEHPAAIATERADLEDSAALPALLSPYHVALSSADYRFNEALARAAIASKTHLCDLGGNLFVVEAELALDQAAREAGVTVVPDCGLAPGMAGLLAALGVQRLDEAESAQLRVGGLPAHPKPPLNYKLVFSVRGLVNEYLEPAEVLRDGQLVRVPSLTEPELIEFPEPFGALEAFTTSGGSSTLPRTLAGRLRELDYKTIRYPGHLAVFAGLHALGMFGEAPVGAVVPRVFTEQMLEASLEDDDTDVVLLRVSVAGKKGGKRGRLVFELIDRHSRETGHSAMARTTAYPAAVVAYMLATGAIERRGVLPGELAVPLEAFLGAVRARGIEVKERWENA
ncbi:MAG: saccharopine dehydrogenase NADP-binding domain-containing protein [Sorangiineae bacterium]|nr:saccharopine dehydrogenase NADP-binding domain-containing protein [Polyangiaceae bacterium]MEB2321746.1 saccharopine dehydrogenase NADP-binding domain-containing protein [Sorangiineae bacterium]